MKKIIRFTASWCQPCKMLAATLEECKIDTPIEVVDIDENMELAKQYGVRGVPTMVLVDGDKEVARLVGLHGQKQLEEWANV